MVDLSVISRQVAQLSGAGLVERRPDAIGPQVVCP
jgi:DNA-binding MarR family transcriptional regulator